MERYQKIGLAGAVFGTALFAGSFWTFLNASEYAEALNPSAKPFIEKIGRESRNKSIIEGTINDADNTLACIPCYAEKDSVRAKSLDSELSQFNRWNRLALDNVNEKIAGYQKAPEMLSYESSKRNLANLGYYGALAGIGLGVLSVIGNDAVRRRKERLGLSEGLGSALSTAESS